MFLSLLPAARLCIRTPPGYYRAEGIIKNVNTLEEYRGIDKAHMLHQAGRTVSVADEHGGWS